MSKPFDLSKSSDRRKFENELMQSVKSVAEDAIKEDGIEIECPHCGKSFIATVGDNTCVHCSGAVTIDLNL